MKQFFTTVLNMIAIRRFDKKTWNFLNKEVDIRIYAYGWNGAYYWYGNNKPYITLPLNERDCDGKMWSSLLHELGHHRDRTEKGPEVFQQVANTILEINAWKYAEELAIKYDLPLDKEFAIECFNSYGTTFSPFGVCADRSLGIV